MKQQKFLIKEEATYEHDDHYAVSTNTTATSHHLKQHYPQQYCGSSNSTKSFNLRKINANRVYLNSLGDKNNTRDRPDAARDNEDRKKTALNSEKCQFLALFQLKPAVKHAHTASFTKSMHVKNEPCLDINETRLNPDSSLVDQILATHKSVAANQMISAKDSGDKSKFDTVCTPRTPHPTFDSLKLRISDKIRRVDAISCVYEYLLSIGGTSVPFDCFQHVLFQLRHARHVLNANLETSSYMNAANSPVATPTSSDSLLGEQQLVVPQNNSKFEFIYAENFYWIVKVKKYYNNLFQLKFMRSTNTNSNSVMNNTNTSSHTSTNIMNASGKLIILFSKIIYATLRINNGTNSVREKVE